MSYLRLGQVCTRYPICCQAARRPLTAPTFLLKGVFFFTMYLWVKLLMAMLVPAVLLILVVLVMDVQVAQMTVVLFVVILMKIKMVIVVIKGGRGTVRGGELEVIKKNIKKRQKYAAPKRVTDGGSRDMLNLVPEWSYCYPVEKITLVG